MCFNTFNLKYSKFVLKDKKMLLEVMNRKRKKEK